MREIKFRMWDIIDKEYRYFDLVDIIGRDGYSVNYEDQIFEQYTDIHDASGKEIYEGEIVKIYPGFGCTWKPRIGYVEKGGATFWLRVGSEAVILDDHDCTLEVLGNIHENKELLNG